MSKRAKVDNEIGNRSIPVCIKQGEDEHINMSITSANVSLTVHLGQGLLMCTVALRAVNESARASVDGHLKFPLPTSGAVVCEYKVNGIPAAVVESKSAAYIASRERFLRNSVGVVSNAQGNLWEASVSPMNYK